MPRYCRFQISWRLQRIDPSTLYLLCRYSIELSWSSFVLVNRLIDFSLQDLKEKRFHSTFIIIETYEVRWSEKLNAANRNLTKLVRLVEDITKTTEELSLSTIKNSRPKRRFWGKCGRGSRNWLRHSAFRESFLKITPTESNCKKPNDCYDRHTVLATKRLLKNNHKELNVQWNASTWSGNYGTPIKKVIQGQSHFRLYLECGGKR